MRCLLVALLLEPLLLRAAQQEPSETAPLTPESIEFFEKHIRPVLVERCYACHSATAAKLKGGLRLDSRDGLRKGGDTGAAILPGDPERSLLIRAIRRGPDVEKMPPKDSEKLSPEQLRSFETWVKMGAPDPRVTAAVPPRR